MSVNSEDWDVDFAFPDFNLALLERERRWCRNWIVTFPWKKICSVFENFNADHAWRWEWTGRNSRGFPKKINERIPLDNDNKLTLKVSLPFAVFFLNFFNMANLFSLSRKPFVVCYCFREPIKTFSLDTCQMIVKSRVLHLFPVPETGRSHIINILLASFFRSVL